jgi:hypothetical protein
MENQISVVLNVYKRPHTLEQQISAIKKQSIPIASENIHVWYNKSGIAQNLPTDKNIKTYVCNWNTKFWGRFTIPLFVTTPFVAMFDDDVMPGSDWFKNCLETIENPETNGILGGSGVILKAAKYKPNGKVGWNGINNNETRRVDLVGHAWFFRQEWLKYLWYEKPYTWDNGEDIMFSYLAQKYAGINTFVPPHPPNQTDLWSTWPRFSRKHGDDKNASYRKGTHYGVRDRICKYCVKNGWDTVNKVKI